MNDYQERTKGAIKCYFVLNKGKWITTKEISEFLQGAKELRLGGYGKTLSPRKISAILKTRLFDDLEVKVLNDNRKAYRYKVND